MNNKKYTIRAAQATEFGIIGQLMVEVYAQLDGFPTIDEQPKYYQMLKNIGRIVEKPKVKLFIAVSNDQKIVGAVVYFGDMKYYGSGGSATKEKNAAGFRLLAIANEARGNGLGKLLTQYCIRIAKDQMVKQMIIHTTNTMPIAWKMYEKIGFKRSNDLDFLQGDLPVFGFRLLLC